MFDALLRMQLGPIIERLAEMEAQLEDLYRRADSFCRIGVCQEGDAAGNAITPITPSTPRRTTGSPSAGGTVSSARSRRRSS